MAQFFRSFANDPDGPRPSDILRTWITNNEAEISDGSLILPHSGSNLRRGFYMDGIGEASDSEIFMEFERTGNSFEFLALRANDAIDSARSGFMLLILGSSLRISSAVNGSESGLREQSIPRFGTSRVCVRFRVSGSGTADVRARLWVASEHEQDEWDVEVLGSTAEPADYTGLQLFGPVGSSSAYFTKVYSVGVGTNGDPAPTGPVSSDRRRSPLLLAPF